MSIAISSNDEVSYSKLQNQDIENCWKPTGPKLNHWSTIKLSRSKFPLIAFCKETKTQKVTCQEKCFTQAFKYSTKLEDQIQHSWFVQRSCGLGDGIKPLNGLKVQTSTCNQRNGTLCNSNFGPYDIDTEVKSQSLKKLMCFTCSTGQNNTNSNHSCFIEQKAQAAECPNIG